MYCGYRDRNRNVRINKYLEYHNIDASRVAAGTPRPEEKPRNQFSSSKSATKLRKPVKIYLLIDHRGKPFYAGRTNRKLQTRLDEHIAEASPTAGPKQRYIWTMQQGGFSPTIRLVTTITTTEEDAVLAERRAIQQFGLTNIVVP